MKKYIWCIISKIMRKLKYFFGKGLFAKIKWYTQLNFKSFLYYNYLCKNVIRESGHRIIPYKHTCISIASTAKLYLNGDMILNDQLLKGSRQECLLLLRDGAEMTVNGTVQLYYGTTLQVHNNARLTIGEAHMNTGTTLICGYKMTIGNQLSTARGVFIFDSDYHPIYNEEGKRINEPKEVIIGDHVWIGLKSTVMKGTVIESGAVISAHSLVSGHIPGNAITATAPARPVMKDIRWER